MPTSPSTASYQRLRRSVCGRDRTTSVSSTIRILQAWVEHFPYQDGLLVWYYDTSFPDNNVGDACGGGRCGGLYLPVDAHPDLLIRPDNGKVWRPRVQAYDSTFGLEMTDRICLHANSVPQCYGGTPGQPAVRRYAELLGYAESRDRQLRLVKRAVAEDGHDDTRCQHLGTGQLHAGACQQVTAAPGPNKGAQQSKTPASALRGAGVSHWERARVTSSARKRGTSAVRSRRFFVKDGHTQGGSGADPITRAERECRFKTTIGTTTIPRKLGPLGAS